MRVRVVRSGVMSIKDLTPKHPINNATRPPETVCLAEFNAMGQWRFERCGAAIFTPGRPLRLG